jgi:predicted subunit of tRNA(5-methylaminomethyl-2-thiouridylate) methyltransferase
MKYPDLDINGMKTESDVCNMIIDTIDSGDLESAKDYVSQFKDYLHSKEHAIQQQDPRHNQEPLMVTGLENY